MVPSGGYEECPTNPSYLANVITSGFSSEVDLQQKNLSLVQCVRGSHDSVWFS